MMENSDSIIGSTIEYEFKKGILQEGVVIDKIQMLHQDKNENNNITTVTGYLVLDVETEKITPITYWRITRLFE